MEYSRETQRTCRSNRSVQKHSGSILGTILIIVGVLWILSELGAQIVSWDFGFPEVLLIVGVILLVGRRSVGVLLIILAFLFLLPHIIIPGILLILFFPILLIILGVIVIARFL